MDPFRMPANRRCRKNYTRDMCARSLEILSRTVMIGVHPDRTPAQTAERIREIRSAAAEVLGPPAARPARRGKK